MKCITTAIVAFFVACSSLAETREIGDWFFGADDDGMPYMVSINDSGGILGKYCNLGSESCFWLLFVKTQCDADASIPALLSTKRGAKAVELSCLGVKMFAGERYYRLMFNDFESLNDAATSDSQVGVAVASKDESFRVFRFGLKGGATAMRSFEAAANARIALKRRRGGSTADKVL